MTLIIADLLEERYGNVATKNSFWTLMEGNYCRDDALLFSDRSSG